MNERMKENAKLYKEIEKRYQIDYIRSGAMSNPASRNTINEVIRNQKTLRNMMIEILMELKLRK